MEYEHVFTVKDSQAFALEKIDLADAGFLERQHLQEWLVANPTVLGDDVMIVTIEFDRWQTYTGTAKKDRLDILAIDSSGRLLVAELKRGEATSHIDLQALKYAAAVSRFDPETLVHAHERYLKQQGEAEAGHELARKRLEAHIDGPLEQDTWLQPRIALVAHGFDETVTNTVVWLSEAGLDITLLRYQLYKTAGDPLFVVSQMYPTPETEQFILAPRREEVEQTKAKAVSGERQKDAVKVLAAEKALPVGTSLHLEPSGINQKLRDAVTRWLAEDPKRAEGMWTGDPAEPIHWAYTDTRGKPSTFATQALIEATGIKRALNGARWWFDDEGNNLADLATTYMDAKRATHDWSGLHLILEQLPSDRWTTYGDLGAVIGTAPQPLGQHLAACLDCTNAVQVLTNNGTSSDGFAWNDPDEMRTPQEALEAGGIRFVDGAADPGQRLSMAEIESLSEGTDINTHSE